MARHRPFFATTSDTRRLLEGVHAHLPITFILTGMFHEPAVTERSLGEVLEQPEGSTPERYMVLPPGVPVQIRSVPQRKGGIMYAIDSAASPKAILFQPGGRRETCLIAGEVAAGSTDPDSQKLFRHFDGELRAQFRKVQSAFLGSEAAQLFDSGLRCTWNPRSPPEYDLRRT